MNGTSNHNITITQRFISTKRSNLPFRLLFNLRKRDGGEIEKERKSVQDGDIRKFFFVLFFIYTSQIQTFFWRIVSLYLKIAIYKLFFFLGILSLCLTIMTCFHEILRLLLTLLYFSLNSECTSRNSNFFLWILSPIPFDLLLTSINSLMSHFCTSSFTSFC